MRTMQARKLKNFACFGWLGALWHKTIAVCFLIVLVWICHLVWSFYYGVEAERRPFLTETWKEKANVYEHSSDPGCVRGDMALDIVATNLLQGKSVTDVQTLLGQPDGITSEGNYYELGQCSGLGWHNSILLVSFNNNQKTTNAVIVRH